MKLGLSIASEVGVDVTTYDEGYVDTERFAFHPKGVHDRVCSCFGSRVCTEPGKCTVYVIRAQSDDIGDILRNSQETGDGPNSNSCPTFALSHVRSNSFRKPPNSKRVYLESFSSILDRHVKYRSYIKPDTSYSKQLRPDR